ncbi:MAG: ankyrin repeat domain-containing protein [Spirochaetales bacterium]|nr:ankyrin repeat domain-containing protein [Spirochaetales bacterium]
MKILMLGRKKDAALFSTFEKLFELERFDFDVVFFDDCEEDSIVVKLRESDLFLLFPHSLAGVELEPEEKDSFLLEAFTSGYIMSQAGKGIIFSRDKDSLNRVFGSEPVVSSIGRAIGLIRKRKEVLLSNKAMLDARKVISDAQLSFSGKGLFEAVERGMYKETQAFLAAGFSTETENGNGVPILSVAVRNGNLGLCRLLMSYDAALNIIARDRVTSPMMDAVTAVNTEIAELLIDAGADLNYRNKNGQSALIVAIGARMEDIAFMLIEKGADTSLKDSLGMSAYDYAKLFSLAGLKEKLEK